MSNLTEKMQAYAEARANGMNRTQSAIHAGYAAGSASRMGPTLEKRADIKAAIIKLKRGSKKGAVADVDIDARMLPKYGSSLELLQHTYNNSKMPDSVRMRAAEQALPYEHGRIGEKGKKEKAVDRAKAVTGSRNKFSPKSHPKLHIVK